jgi:hypothetical protein
MVSFLKTKIKQIFCKHIWLEENHVELRTTREKLAMLTYVEYKYYALFERCVKCDLKKIREKRVIQL